MTTRDYILSTLKLNKPRLQSLGVKDVGLFGSYGRNELSQDRDTDILLDFENEKETFNNYTDACNFFEELVKNELVEIFTKNGLSRHLGPKCGGSFLCLKEALEYLRHVKDKGVFILSVSGSEHAKESFLQDEFSSGRSLLLLA